MADKDKELKVTQTILEAMKTEVALKKQELEDRDKELETRDKTSLDLEVSKHCCVSDDSLFLMISTVEHVHLRQTFNPQL